jgi:hypothetical protein
MNLAFEPKSVGGGRPSAAEGTPTIFVRTQATPPGLPWDQARAAELEARAAAPLPLSDVLYQLRRLDPWFIGRPARYAALYMRSSEGGRDVQSVVEVAGRRLKVRFLSAGEKRRRARLVAVATICAVGSVALGAAAVQSALASREEAVGRLDAMELIARSRTRAANAQEHLRLQGRALVAAGVQARSLDAALDDLAWASSAKTSNAHIDAFHWERGRMAVEVRGEAAPFVGSKRLVVQAKKPLRPGVWLWGVAAQASTGGAR